MNQTTNTDAVTILRDALTAILDLPLDWDDNFPLDNRNSYSTFRGAICDLRDKLSDEVGIAPPHPHPEGWKDSFYVHRSGKAPEIFLIGTSGHEVQLYENEFTHLLLLMTAAAPTAQNTERAAIQPAGEANEPLLWAALDLNGRIVYQHASRENVEMNRRYIKTPTSVVGLVVQCAAPATQPEAKAEPAMPYATSHEEGRHTIMGTLPRRHGIVPNMNFGQDDNGKPVLSQSAASSVTSSPDAAAQGSVDLLPLPEPNLEDQYGDKSYTSDQMHDYARAHTAQHAAVAEVASRDDAVRKFLTDCAATSGGMVNGNHLARYAKKLLDATPTASTPPAPAEKGDEVISPVYAWLERSAQNSSPEVAYAARTMMAYWQGAEFPAAASPLMQVAPSDAERIAHLEGEEEISEAVIAMMSRILASISITLKGEEEALKRHSYHDLAELVQVMALELDLYKEFYGTAAPVPPAVAPEQSVYVPIATLELINDAMNHMGDQLNEMDVVEEEDEAIVAPAFDAIRALISKEAM